MDRLSKIVTRDLPSMRCGSAGGGRRMFATRARTPDVNASEQEQPHDVNEVPIPSCGLETEMLLRREMTNQRAD